MSWLETCACKCKWDASICNNRQRWNKDKCRCECKKLLNKGRCDDGFIWNLSTCESEYGKSCDVGEYLNYVNCKFIKRLIDNLVEKCDGDIDRNGIVYNATLYNYGRVCNFCTLCVVLLIIAFKIIIGISGCVSFFGIWREINSVQYLTYLTAAYIKMLCYNKIKASEVLISNIIVQVIRTLASISMALNVEYR